jgi:hypothetical protein
MSKGDEQESWERDRLAWNLPRPRHDEVTLAEDLLRSLERSVSSQDEKVASLQRPAQGTDEV